MTTEVITPQMVEQRIFEASNRIAQGVTVRSKLRTKVTEAKRIFDVKYSMAFLDAEGSIDARKHVACVKTVKERRMFEDAELVYKHAETTARSLEQELSALQSIASSIRETFKTAGVGER